MKIIVALFLASLIFIPSTAFGWKSLSSLYEKECIVDCNYGHANIDSSKPMNFILLGSAFLIGLGIFIRMGKLGKYETFSLKCKNCGKGTRGLKCVYCEAEKQRAT